MTKQFDMDEYQSLTPANIPPLIKQEAALQRTASSSLHGPLRR